MDIIITSVVLVWMLIIIWQVIIGASIVDSLYGPTLIQLDLLQALAFLVAWTLFMWTITVRVINKVRDLELESLRGIKDLELDHLREMKDLELESARTEWDLTRHLEDHPATDEQVSDMASRLNSLEEGAVAEIKQLRRENEELRQENERLIQDD